MTFLSLFNYGSFSYLSGEISRPVGVIWIPKFIFLLQLLISLSIKFSVCSEYTNFDEITVLTRGDAAWHYPEGKYVYGKFSLKESENNVSDYLRAW